GASTLTPPVCLSRPHGLPIPMCLLSMSGGYWTTTPTVEISELARLLIVMSMILYFPPNGTAGFARSFVNSPSLVPLPPAKSIATTLDVILNTPILIFFYFKHLECQGCHRHPYMLAFPDVMFIEAEMAAGIGYTGTGKSCAVTVEYFPVRPRRRHRNLKIMVDIRPVVQDADFECCPRPSCIAEDRMLPVIDDEPSEALRIIIRPVEFGIIPVEPVHGLYILFQCPVIGIVQQMPVDLLFVFPFMIHADFLSHE